MKKLAAILMICFALFAAPAASYAAPQHISTEMSRSDAPKLTVGNGYIEIQNATDCTFHLQIFSITGQLVKNITIAPSDNQLIDIPSGCYIVKCEKWSKKVVVK